MVNDNDKDVSIQKLVIDHILFEREGQQLPAPAPDSRLSGAARDTSIWLSSKEDFEDEIFEYLMQRMAEQSGDADGSIRFPKLAYGIHSWPVDTEPSEIANDLVEKMNLSKIARDPTLDYLGMSSSFAVLNQSGSPVEATGGQPVSFGYALVVAYATDGNSAIVDRINERREKVGVAPLQISAPLREMARKYIAIASTDEAGDSVYDDAQTFGYATEGWRVRLYYSGSYAKFPSGEMNLVGEPEMADIVATQLVKDWPILLRPDWQDVGIATGAKNHPELGGLNFQAEFVIGWRIPFDAERPAHFPPPMDKDGNPSTTADADAGQGGKEALDDLLGPVYREPDPKPQRRRGWWPFRS